MALAPRLSLRSVMLLMSRGKPRLSSFFSSSAATGVPPAAPGADAPPASPAVKPPAPPGRSCPKLPVKGEFILHPIHGGPRPRGAVKGVTNKACLNAPEDPSSAYTTPGYGSCSTPHKHPCGASEDVKPPPARGGGGHRVVDPPRRGRGRRAVPDEPEQCAQEHLKYPVPDSSSDEVFSSCSSAVPPPCTPAAPDVQPPGTPAPPDRSGHKLPDHEESVVDPLRDPPPRNRLNPVIKEPAQCTLDNPKYPSPDHFM